MIATHLTASKTLSDGAVGLISETPKLGDIAFDRVFNVIVGNNEIAVKAARKTLSGQGLNTLLLPHILVGEARDAGNALALYAENLTRIENSISRPAGIVAGGETTVKVVGKGIGGRNQEVALSGCLKLKGVNNCVLASIGTDGIDGPTTAAGAIVDSLTFGRAKDLGLDPQRFLDDNDSCSFFSQLGDLLLTGPTGTNVNDISVLVIL